MSKVQVNKASTLTGHHDCVYTLEEIPGTPTFFSGSGDGMIVRWTHRQEDGALVARMKTSVYALAYDSTSGHLLAGHNYEGLHVIDWQAQKEIGSLRLHSAAYYDIKIAGRQAWVACGDGSVMVINLSTLTVEKKLEDATQSARTIAIHPLKKEVAIGYSDHHIRVYGLDDYKLLRTFTAHANSVFTVKYSQDGSWLLSGSRDARLKVWETDNEYRLKSEIAAHLYAINDVRFSPDWKHFVTCSMDKSVKVWRTEDLTLLKVIDKARHAGHGTSVNKLLWSSFNNRIVSASDDRTISIWDVIF